MLLRKAGKVDIIIPTFNNLLLLQECIKSLRLNTDYPYQIHVINSGTDGTKEWLQQQPDIILHNSETRLHFSAANNVGIKNSSSPYVCFLNDDTICAIGWLNALMREVVKPGVGGVNPFSNCDLGWLHQEVIKIGNIDLVPSMSLEQIKPVIPQIYNLRHEKVVNEREWIAFFCTLIPRSVIDEIGFLDESFKSGCEDYDWCLRAKEKEYRFITTYDSVVFHFGAATRKRVESIGDQSYHDEDKENHRILEEKHKSVKMEQPKAIPTLAKYKILPEQPKSNSLCSSWDKPQKPVEITEKVSSPPIAREKSPNPPLTWINPVLPSTWKSQAAQLEAYALKEHMLKEHSLKSNKNADKPKFVMYTGQAWEKWSPKSLETGIGGSETCTVYTAREFAKRGWDSYVFGDPGSEAGTYDGVKYIDHNEFNKFVNENEMDIFISSRRADIFVLPIKARKKICVVHDIFLSPDRNANLYLDKVDKFFLLSPWHKLFFCDHHHVPEDKVYITRDAIDLSRFKKDLPRERARLIYTSSPDRGLDVLLDILPRIQKALPMATLHIFYGFFNWEQAVRARQNQAEIQWMENIKKQLKKPGVVFHGRIGQNQLAKEFMQAELWAYPTYFTETFAISAAEAMAAGLPVITSNLAALSTTVGDAGILLNGDPRSEMYQNEFTAQCIDMLTNWNKWCEYSKRSREKASKYSWETLIDDWIEQLK